MANIALNRGFTLVLEDLPLDDAAVRAARASETLGVFQLDGGPMRSLLRLMRPDNFEDISAVLALYRRVPVEPTATRTMRCGRTDGRRSHRSILNWLSRWRRSWIRLTG